MRNHGPGKMAIGVSLGLQPISGLDGKTPRGERDVENGIR